MDHRLSPKAKNKNSMIFRKEVIGSKLSDQKRKWKQNILLFLAIVLAGIGCNNETTAKFQPKPMAIGKLNDVVIISDKTLWESFLQDTVLEYFGTTFPVMPTPEPMFDVRHFTPSDLQAESLRRELRTYVVIGDVNNASSETTEMIRRDLGEEKLIKAKTDPGYTSAVGLDKWANDQVIIYIFGAGADNVAKAVRENFPAVASRINKHDERQLSANIYAKKGYNTELNQRITDSFHLSLNIPADYYESVSVDKNNFIWLKRDLKVLEQHLVIRKFPYTSADQLSKENIIKWRDEYGQKYIKGSSEESYMITNGEDLPIYEYKTTIDGAYAREVRGMWEMTGDFIAGAFISFAIVNEARKEIIFVDTFVFGPGQSKRDYIQQLEYLVKKSKLV